MVFREAQSGPSTFLQHCLYLWALGIDPASPAQAVLDEQRALNATARHQRINLTFLLIVRVHIPPHRGNGIRRLPQRHGRATFVFNLRL
jgi:hypothetical protein